MKRLLLSTIVLLCISTSTEAQKKNAPKKKAAQSRISTADQQRINVKIQEEKNGFKTTAKPATKNNELRAETLVVEQKAVTPVKN